MEKTTNKNLLDQLLGTAEVFHYAKKFRNSIFVISLPNSSYLDEIIEDLRVIALAEIKTIICLPQSSELHKKLKLLNQLGVPTILHGSTTNSSEIQLNNYQQLELEEIEACKSADLAYWEACLKFSTEIKASKLFFLGEHEGLEVNQSFKPNPTPKELKDYLKSNFEINIDRDLLQLIANNVDHCNLDMILLSGATGSLYQEIFTHYGCGTLFADREVRRLRRARTTDIMDIMLLMKPYVDSNLILPVTDDDILREIDTYHVLTVDSAVIASAKLSDYGEASEFAKFCTLPRYRGKGRAKSLALQLLKVAANHAKQYVFALTIDEHAAEFFLNLGFVEVDRQSLPIAWREKYDFSRPSRGFKFSL